MFYSPEWPQKHSCFICALLFELILNLKILKLKMDYNSVGCKLSWFLSLDFLCNSAGGLSNLRGVVICWQKSHGSLAPPSRRQILMILTCATSFIPLYKHSEIIVNFSVGVSYWITFVFYICILHFVIFFISISDS